MLMQLAHENRFEEQPALQEGVMCKKQMVSRAPRFYPFQIYSNGNALGNLPSSCMTIYVLTLPVGQLIGCELLVA